MFLSISLSKTKTPVLSNSRSNANCECMYVCLLDIHTIYTDEIQYTPKIKIKRTLRLQNLAVKSYKQNTKIKVCLQNFN